ncbi:MAG: ABC transporter substrate-binding protein [Limnochordales bacterium]|nr:ABC transporter substrate-binding protein [Limnochordales bacterium]
MSTRKLVSLGLLLVVATTLVFPAAPAAASTAGQKILNLAGFASYKDFCGLTSTTTPVTDRLIASTLYSVTRDGNTWVPDLAESYEVEGNVWRFHLRKNVLWHDGTPFTAEDVVFTFNLFAHPLAALRGHVVSYIAGYDEVASGQAQELSGVRALDDYTVEIETKAPMATFLSEQLHIPIYPKHRLAHIPVDQICNDPFWTESFVGTGPFMWTRYLEDQRIELTANPHYFRGKPKLDGIVIHLFANAETALAAYAAGTVDIVEVDVTNLDFLNSLANTNITFYRTLTVRSLAVNSSYPEFADPRVRQAMAYAINREPLVRSLFRDTVRPAYTMFPQEWAQPADLNTYPYDPQKARQLLAEAGWRDSQVYELVYYYPDQMTANAMVAIQQMLAQVGIRVNPVFIDPPTLRARINDNSLPMFYGALGVPTDPDAAYTTITCGMFPPGGNNSTRYCNEEVDRLMELGRVTTDQQARVGIYQEVSRILNEELHWVYLWEPLQVVAIRSNVVGAENAVGPSFLRFYGGYENIDIVN